MKRQTLSPCDFDWQQLRQLAGEDSDFENELLAIFLNDVNSSLASLESAIATKSVQTIEEVAHSLRGASANVGAKALAAVALQLEQAARRGEMTGAHSLLRQLHTHCRRIQAQFQARCS
ncbi:MAG: Hpt domain-containing protein [Phormidesmis sp.]